jgi:predicted Fe-Mo cluster-binding NifX family protein
MKLAAACWNQRISPVFDVAGAVEVVDADRVPHERATVALSPAHPEMRAQELADMGVQVLICGAISAPFEEALNNKGIRVLSQTCGPVDEVLQAFMDGRLTDSAFLMPGCRCRRRGMGRRGGMKGGRGCGRNANAGKGRTRRPRSR